MTTCGGAARKNDANGECLLFEGSLAFDEFYRRLAVAVGEGPL